MNDQLDNEARQQGSGEKQPVQKEESSPSAADKGKNPSKQSSSHGLPWGFVAAAAAGFFLLSNKDKLGHDGAFIYIIGAIVLGVLSANMLGRK